MMGTAYRKPRRTLRRKLALHRMRLALLQRRVDRAMADLSMDRRADVELARERLEDAIDEAPTAELERLIVAYDEALVAALAKVDAMQERRTKMIWQVVTAVVVMVMVMAALGPRL